MEQVRRVERHLEDCAGCRRVAALYAQTVSVTQAARQADLPTSQTDWQMLAQRLEPTPTRPARRLLSPAWSGAAAATILIAVALTGYHYRYRGEQSTIPTPNPHTIATQDIERDRTKHPPIGSPANRAPGMQIVRPTEHNSPTDKKRLVVVKREPSKPFYNNPSKRNRASQLATARMSPTPLVRPDHQPDRIGLQTALLDAAPGRSAVKSTEYVVGDALLTDARGGERTYVLGDTLSEDHPVGDAVVEATGW
jgi:hypothetical protein